jgi:hypothetical protein
MTAKFHAQVVGKSNQKVTWSVQQGLGTIDSTGLFTAPRDASGGPFSVVATSQAVPSAQGSAAVTVLVPQVTVAPATITLAQGGTQTFTATVNGLANTEVTWSVQEVSGGSVSAAGLYNAPQSTGFYHVVATSLADTNFSGNATITVTASPGRFTPTGSMQTGRGLHTATLLSNGKVLVAGGGVRWGIRFCGGGDPTATAELYDPVAGFTTTASSMTSPRYAHTATLLTNGAVLITGGFGPPPPDCEDLGQPVLGSAELFNSSAGFFQPTGNMAELREGHTATLLPNGRVLIAGGGDQVGRSSKTAELYDPAAGIFASTGRMTTPRSGHSSTLLANGKVLIAGGVDTSNPDSPTTTSAAETYDPTTGTFTVVGSMKSARAGHTATLLATGRVLIAGGSDLPTAEVYDPATGTFSGTGDMGQARIGHTATLLANGTVLVTGGSDSTAELYDPSTGSFGTTGGMETSRAGHSATLLLNGKVLVVGGVGHLPLTTAELYK